MKHLQTYDNFLLEAENPELHKIRHYMGTIADFKKYWADRLAADSPQDNKEQNNKE